MAVVRTRITVVAGPAISLDLNTLSLVLTHNDIKRLGFSRVLLMLYLLSAAFGHLS
jgi:hypothetical protein